MVNFAKIAGVFALFAVHFAKCDADLLAVPCPQQQDQCVGLCAENSFLLPKLELLNYDQVVCQRGCRFFNIESFSEVPDLNDTQKECHLSCEESYIIKKENNICAIGCNLMMKKREREVPHALLLSEQEDNTNLFLAEPDLELLENNIFSDPGIIGQVEVGYRIAYKIPETRIRTMPIKEVAHRGEGDDDELHPALVIKTRENSGDWLDCASRNSGIPRWILLTAILSAVLLALWLSLSSDKKIASSLEKLMLTKNELIPEKDSCCKQLENEEEGPLPLKRPPDENV